MDHFSPSAILDLSTGSFDVVVGHFESCHGKIGHIANLWAILVRDNLVHGPFWYRPIVKE